MFPAEFDYLRADSVDEALTLLADNPEAELLAGGHSLVPTMKTGLATPEAVVDIGGIDGLQGIDHREDSIRVGAMTTYATVAGDEGFWADATVVAEAARAVGDIQVRNRGTIGGNIAHADPASDLPAAVLAADATIEATGPDGTRTLDVDGFFRGMYDTALADDEILTAIEFPAQSETAGGAYEKRPSPSSGYALVGVAATLATDGDTITSAGVAANGVLDHAVRLDPVEAALEGEPLEEEVLADAAERAAEDLEEMRMMDDLQASAEFRAQLLRAHTRDALETAADRVGTVPTP